MPVQVTLINHPRLHFAQDIINAVTKTALPCGHLIAKLIRPHSRFSLGLDRAVQYHGRSVGLNMQSELYSAYPMATPTAMQHAFHIGRNGVSGKSAYPQFHYLWATGDERSLYGLYCLEWKAVIEAFVETVGEEGPSNDVYVRLWADTISEWVPSFPNGHQY